MARFLPIQVLNHSVVVLLWSKLNLKKRLVMDSILIYSNAIIYKSAVKIKAIPRSYCAPGIEGDGEQACIAKLTFGFNKISVVKHVLFFIYVWGILSFGHFLVSELYWLHCWV